MRDITKIVKFLENSCPLIKCVTEAIEDTVKLESGEFLGIYQKLRRMGPT